MREDLPKSRFFRDVLSELDEPVSAAVSEIVDIASNSEETSLSDSLGRSQGDFQEGKGFHSFRKNL